MSNAHEPRPPEMSPAGRPMTVVPAYYPPPRPRRSPWPWLFCLLLLLLLACSIAFNFFAFAALVPHESDTVNEKFYSGDRESKNKVAIVEIDGVIMEGMTGFARKEIDKAAADDEVKAVVLRVNSPGGTITASDDLHRRLIELRDGNREKKHAAKPLVVSMASLAASGAYYISMTSHDLLAEPTTLTGSIGVYAALPNITELGQKIGFKMIVIKAGQVKDSGSPFHEMTPHEQELWQDMVDHSYAAFQRVVEVGRPKLQGQLLKTISIKEDLPVRTEKGQTTKHIEYERYRADGGIFTADQAKEFGLIDGIGYLEDAIKSARQAAKLGENYQVVEYQKPPTLFGALLGARAAAPELEFGPAKLSRAAVPRVWYLAPEADLAGVLKAMADSEP
jgi:protease-4